MRNPTPPVAAAALSLCLLASCTGDPEPPTPVHELTRLAIANLDSFYLAQLQAHRMVLLGEGRRHDDLVMNDAVVSLLSHWMDRMEAGADVPGGLVLVLEYPGSVGAQLDAFFSSGDVAHFGLELQGRRVSTLAFFHDLRRLRQRCERLRSSVPLDFSILCPEHDYSLSLSAEARHRLAQTERDDRTAANVLAHLESLPDHRFLAYYGAGHLAERPAPIAETVPWGAQVRRRGIDTYAIALLGFATTRHPLPFAQMRADFALTAGDLRALVPQFDARTDAEAYYRAPCAHTLPLKDVPSRLVIDRLLGYVEEMPQLLPALASLWFRYSGRDISRQANIAQYARDHLQELDPIAAIDDLVLLRRVLAGLNARGRPRAEIDQTMMDLTGFRNVLDRRAYPIPAGSSAVELWVQVMNDYGTQIRAQLYASVLFYGAPDEQVKARQRLRALAGRELTGARDWLDYALRLWQEEPDAAARDAG